MGAAPPVRTSPARLGGFVLAVARRFLADHGLVWASALAYVSLLSMVPLMAVMFAVLKGLGVQGRLEGLLLSRLALSQEVTDMIIDYVDKVNVGTLGSLGAAMLLLTVISVLGGIEASFNHVWRVAHSRTWWRKLTDYLSVVLLTPFLMLAAVAITSSMQADRVYHWMIESALIGHAALSALELVPILFNTIAIGMLYSVMPNRRGSPAAIGIGALFAGIAWHFVQLAYIHFQIGMANYNAIYGALSQLPITLVWLYVSWAVVLLGAEIAAVYEFGWEYLGEPATPDSVAVALHALVRAADGFREGGVPVSGPPLARELGLRIETVNEAIALLVQKGWLVAIEGGGYGLGLDPSRMVLAELGTLRPRERLPSGVDPRVRQLLDEARRRETAIWQEETVAAVLQPRSGASAASSREVRLPPGES